MSGDLGERTGVLCGRCLSAAGQLYSPSNLSLFCELHSFDHKFTCALTNKFYAVESPQEANQGAYTHRPTHAKYTHTHANAYIHMQTQTLLCKIGYTHTYANANIICIREVTAQSKFCLCWPLYWSLAETAFHRSCGLSSSLFLFLCSKNA